MIRLLVCDDDKYTVKVLSTIVKTIESVSEVYTAFSGEEAIDIIEKNLVDIALMDIDLPGIDGIEASRVIRAINPSLKIIFITAYRDYAFDSYELKASDYILKPIDFDRVKANISEIIKDINTQKIPQDLLLIKDTNGFHMVEQKNINFIEKDQKDLIVHTSDQVFRTNMTLGEVEEKLNNSFMRTHKSYIVNLKNIKSIEPFGDSSYVIYFKEGDVESSALITRERLKLLQL